MYRFYSHKLKKPVITLTAGEYFVTQNSEVLHTVVGSCITTCIYDKKTKAAGMNHFLLPGMVHPDEILSSEVARYGMFAMELLIGELMKLGAQRKGLRAKVFGGGHVLKFRKDDDDITGSNIRFAKKFLELEGIPAVKVDLGGNAGRKIFFFTDTHRVLLKRFDMRKDQRSLQNEEIYTRRVFEERRAKSRVVLF
ncbi:MAG: chemotaxis protein CheD [Deltaproteobacteria bacterium]|nr:chemotaxis protein CheD [Deltaproteobacteria bacterium]MBW1718317.1 chemotaxis protein CheD [Deltaproteobacteria bacterium]MBW1932504.1 chemotaxis protein CheD [Deltaproteobacteria bacterium]MBW1937484.1 chemotaxis protein CheD [Deltaproteobacteria bacterium]MBW1964323.1 chemotaxis protein CheD [Deltaproteobacteria bacterium]